MIRRGVALVFAVGLVLGGAGSLSACSSVQIEPVGASTKAAVSELMSPPAELEQAVTKVTVECMAREGYAIPYDPALQNEPPKSVTGVVGVFASADDARRYGYSSTVKAGGNEDPIDAFRAGISKKEARAFDRALLGGQNAHEVNVTLTTGAKASMSGTGCLATANRRIYGTVKNALQITEFPNEIYGAADSQAIVGAVHDALPDYDHCMKVHGYDVSGMKAGKLAQSRFGRYRNAGEAPSQAEAQMAEQDAKCQASSGLVKNSTAVFYKGARAWLAKNESMVLARQSVLRNAESEAKRVLEK